jgi:WD40 repeat protein
LLEMPPTPRERDPVRLDTRVLRNLSVGRVHRGFTKPVHSLEFSPDGSVLVGAASDDTLRVLDAQSGEPAKLLMVKKYGVDLMRLVGPDGRAALCASRRAVDCAVRLLSVHTNAYLCYFRGHRDRVASLAAAPGGDGFASAAEDAEVRFWDVRTPVCQGVLRVAEYVVVPGPALAWRFFFCFFFFFLPPTKVVLGFLFWFFVFFCCSSRLGCRFPLLGY